MCGIAGFASARGASPAMLPEMAAAIRHRGPDGEGYLVHGGGGALRALRSLAELGSPPDRPAVGFAHQRLAIIDLSEANDQPIVDEAGELALIVNGEIYNYLELRRELEELGHSFRTSGDTEVLLAAYSHWGPGCLRRLVGMWAFAILDIRRRSLFLSRDRFGIKPLYYAESGGTFYFASEIKALLAVPGLRPRPDEATVRRYLLTGLVDESERTFFDGVRSLPAAHNLTVPLDDAGVRTSAPERYWSIPEPGYGGGPAEAAEEFRALLTESVRLHARSDVPVGTCLSGGLDSSAIVCVADRLRERDEVPSYAHSGFGYVPDDEEFSERRYMEEVAEQTSLRLTYIEASAERFSSALVALIRQQDEPFGTTSIGAQWFVFEAAHEAGLKVMLDGQGADEVLGGYHHFFPHIALALLRSGRLLAYARFARAHRRAFGMPAMRLRFALGSLAPSSLRRAASSRLAHSPASTLLSDSLRRSVEPADYRFPSPRSPHEMLAVHTSSLGLPALLRFEDRNSMAHSIEARVPFLDHRLVEFAFALPAEFKIDGAGTKHVLREAMRGVLPESIRSRRDKIGFRADPAVTWALAERNREALLAPATEAEERWFDAGALASLLDGSDRSTDAEFALWRVVNTKLWARTLWGDRDRVLA